MLQQYAARSDEDFAVEQDALFRFAETHGRNPRTGFVVNALGQDGRVRDAASRLWMQTEELKAHLALGERDGHIDVPRVKGCGRHPAQPLLRSLWRRDGADRCRQAAGSTCSTPKGEPAVKVMPTSSLYQHLLAFAELQRMAA